MRTTERRKQWARSQDRVFDVVIVGGGINGACLYHRLCQSGYSVLLLEKGDFAGGTSQASAMMIWGGLLYLRYGDLLTVGRLCASRDRMLREMSDWVVPQRFRYVAAGANGRAVARHRSSLLFARAALYLYWLMGGCRRLFPRFESDYIERGFLAPDRHGGTLVYEEGCVEPSDARFVLHWLEPFQNDEQSSINYCALTGGSFDRSLGQWQLDVHDVLLDMPGRVRCRWVVNAAGVWTDTVNELMGILSPYKHVLSKGVFIGLQRDQRHELPLIFETRGHSDGMSLIPWGPISLWGPTETIADTPDGGFGVEPEDVRILLDELNALLRDPVDASQIVSLRCGVRPLVVDRGFDPRRATMALSRRHRICMDPHLPWISVFGGKLTNCMPIAKQVTRRIKRILSPSGNGKDRRPRDVPDPVLEAFPGLDQPVPSAKWCADWQMCWTLEDYLRRRTNVAQWIARGGLGAQDEHAGHLTDLAAALNGGDREKAGQAVGAYRLKIAQEFDRPLAGC